MDKRIPPARWVPATAIVAVCIAALGAATFGVGEPAAPVQAARPAADTPVDVVRAPVPASSAEGACRTCTMGAGKGWL